MVGCTRQSANRVIGQFTDDGLIRVDRDSITVRTWPVWNALPGAS